VGLDLDLDLDLDVDVDPEMNVNLQRLAGLFLITMLRFCSNWMDCMVQGQVQV
jgi:hypothetical protein